MKNTKKPPLKITAQRDPRIVLEEIDTKTLAHLNSILDLRAQVNAISTNTEDTTNAKAFVISAFDAAIKSLRDVTLMLDEVAP